MLLINISNFKSLRSRKTCRIDKDSAMLGDSASKSETQVRGKEEGVDGTEEFTAGREYTRASERTWKSSSLKERIFPRACSHVSVVARGGRQDRICGTVCSAVPLQGQYSLHEIPNRLRCDRDGPSDQTETVARLAHRYGGQKSG